MPRHDNRKVRPRSLSTIAPFGGPRWLGCRARDTHFLAHLRQAIRGKVGGPVMQPRRIRGIRIIALMLCLLVASAAVHRLNDSQSVGSPVAVRKNRSATMGSINRARKELSFPPSVAPPVGAATVTRAIAEEEARSARGFAGGASAGWPKAPAASVLMRYAGASRLVGQAMDPRISPGRLVWVVTVYAAMPVSGPPSVGELWIPIIR